jgi:hypothetical protein
VHALNSLLSRRRLRRGLVLLNRAVWRDYRGGAVRRNPRHALGDSLLQFSARFRGKSAPRGGAAIDHREGAQGVKSAL